MDFLFHTSASCISQQPLGVYCVKVKGHLEHILALCASQIVKISILLRIYQHLLKCRNTYSLDVHQRCFSHKSLDYDVLATQIYIVIHESRIRLALHILVLFPKSCKNRLYSIPVSLYIYGMVY